MVETPDDKIIIMRSLKECEEMVERMPISRDDIPVVCDMINEVKVFLADLEAC